MSSGNKFINLHPVSKEERFDTCLENGARELTTILKNGNYLEENFPDETMVNNLRALFTPQMETLFTENKITLQVRGAVRQYAGKQTIFDFVTDIFAYKVKKEDSQNLDHFPLSFGIHLSAIQSSGESHHVTDLLGNFPLRISERQDVVKSKIQYYETKKEVEQPKAQSGMDKKYFYLNQNDILLKYLVDFLCFLRLFVKNPAGDLAPTNLNDAILEGRPPFENTEHTLQKLLSVNNVIPFLPTIALRNYRENSGNLVEEFVTVVDEEIYKILPIDEINESSEGKNNAKSSPSKPDKYFHKEGSYVPPRFRGKK